MIHGSSSRIRDCGPCIYLYTSYIERQGTLFQGAREVYLPRSLLGELEWVSTCRLVYLWINIPRKSKTRRLGNTEVGTVTITLRLDFLEGHHIRSPLSTDDRIPGGDAR